VKLDLNKANSLFIQYWLQGAHAQNQISISKSLAAQPNLFINSIQKLRCPLPTTVSEQHAVATTLSDMDVLLGALDRFIAKKRDIKQAVMQQLLTGHTRLPGFHGEWRTARLKDFVTADRFAIVDGPFGSQLKVDEYVASGVPVIEMEHLIDSYITERIERCITHKKFDDLKRSAVYPGDIIISKTGSLGKLGIIPQTVERGLITSRLAKITLNPSRADRLFVFQFLLKLRNDGYWEKVSQGGTMQILGIGMLQDAPIPDISPAEQTAIAAVLTDMDTELAALEQRLDKTRALKQGMMQELLTGKTRLVSKEDVAHA
jgi:type I restriction enzyme, S subunit